MGYADSYVGKILAGYQILGVIRDGRLGPVLRAAREGRQVVLKLLCPQFPEELQRRSFLYRAKALQKLAHPNIAPLLDFGELRVEQYGPSYLYTVFELFEGYDLEGALAAKGPFPREEALSIARQAASALCAAHQEGLLHRSLEAGDIFLVDKDPNQIKVLDFGVGKYTFEPGQEAELETLRRRATYNPPLPPSLLYFPPESILEGSTDRRADIYALGVVLYQALTGVSPFSEQSSGMQFLVKMLQGELSVQEHPKIPGEVWLVLQKMLSKEKEKRYQTMREALCALEGLAPHQR